MLFGSGHVQHVPPPK